MIKEYVLSVITASFAAGIFGILSPEKSGMGKYVKFLISLALILCIILPLRDAADLIVSFVSDPASAYGDIEGELEGYVERTNEQIIEQNTEMICSAIKKELKDKLGIPAHECDLTLEFESGSGEIRLKKVNVFLSGYSMWRDPRDIKSLVSELTDSECEVIAG